ncbi:MAG: SMP-30/gluconolactonase/LRE family protein [Hyphomonadaceae bacterium]
MTRTPRLVLEGLAFPEGPRWRAGELWFSDMHAHEIVAMKPDGSRRTILTHDHPVSGLGWLPDGRLLFVSMDDRKLMRREEGGQIVQHADLSGVATWHANDMVVDAQGRAYVGNFGFSLHPPEDPKPARLARVDPDGRTHVAAGDMMFPNGSVITPDGKTLIVGESWGRRLSAFDIAADGALSNRRVWADTQPAVPDGICLDAEGAIWIASPPTNEAVRFREGGEALERVACECGAYACMLGGADRKTLFILTAESADPAVCKANRTGRIEAVAVDAPGAGLP